MIFPVFMKYKYETSLVHYSYSGPRAIVCKLYFAELPVRSCCRSQKPLQLPALALFLELAQVLFFALAQALFLVLALALFLVLALAKKKENLVTSALVL